MQSIEQCAERDDFLASFLRLSGLGRQIQFKCENVFVTSPIGILWLLSNRRCWHSQFLTRFTSHRQRKEFKKLCLFGRVNEEVNERGACDQHELRFCESCIR